MLALLTWITVLGSRSKSWTRLNNHLRDPYPYNSNPHFRTPADWYLDKRKQLYFVCHLSRVSSATYHQNSRYSGSTTFKHMIYESSICETQGHRSWPDIHAPPDCYVANQYTTIFCVSSTSCIDGNRCHLASDWVSGYAVTRKWSRVQARSIGQRALGLTTEGVGLT